MQNSFNSPTLPRALPLSRLMAVAGIAGCLLASIASADAIDGNEDTVELSVFRVEADQLDKDVADQLTTSRRLGDLTTTVPRSVVVVDPSASRTGAPSTFRTRSATPRASPPGPTVSIRASTQRACAGSTP